MAGWNDNQENHVLVKHDLHGNMLIKINPQTTVSEVLKRVCNQWNLTPDKHTLSYCTQELTDGTKRLSTCIPHNATLYIKELNPDNNWLDAVTVSLQMDDIVFSKLFNKKEKLSDIVDQLSANVEDSKKKAAEMQVFTDKNQSNKAEEKIKCSGERKILVQLSLGSIIMDNEDLKTTRLADLSHEGVLFLMYINEDAEETCPSDIGNLEQTKYKDNDPTKPLSDKSKVDMHKPESQPSVTKLKQALEAGWNKKNATEIPIIIHRALELNELFDRFGLVYKMDGDESSITNYSETEIYDSDSLHEIYTQSWISICFIDDLALQAAFSPSEFVQDIKKYVKQFLNDSTIKFQLYQNDKLLDENQTIFSQGLVPTAKINFIIEKSNLSDDEEQQQDKIDNLTTTFDRKLMDKMEKLNVGANLLKPQYIKKILSQSAAIATALKFKITDTSVTIESEVIPPSIDEIKKIVIK